MILQPFRLRMSGIQRPVVAAIDFGSSYSGYAFSFKQEPDRIYLNDTWKFGTHTSYKTPTCLLLNPLQQFKAFGYEAVEKYQHLLKLNRHEGWMFFRNFKTDLYKEHNSSAKILSLGGQAVSAVIVISFAIGYLKNHMMCCLKNYWPTITDDAITFIVTVPSIWNDRAKQIMREASSNAGIPNHQLLLCLEPEAASIYCQSLRLPICRNGERYLVVDMGGGTVDITAHAKQDNGTLKELTASGGAAFGGQCVLKEFLSLLNEIFGKQVMTILLTEYTDEWFALINEFEIQKLRTNPDKHDYIQLLTPPSLNILMEKIEKWSAQKAIEHCDFADYIKLRNGELCLDISVLKHLFSKSTENVLSKIEELLETKHAKRVKKLVLVGGHSKSAFVQNAFEHHFDWSFSIISPPDPDLAILKGAVLFGHNPGIISSRILKYTYGTDVSPVFDRRFHPASRRSLDGGVHRCKDVFDIFITAGSKVKYGHKIRRKYSPTSTAQSHVTINLYASKEKFPLFVADRPSIGSISVKLPKFTGERREIELTLIFGHTEIYALVTDSATGETISETFNFLG